MENNMHFDDFNLDDVLADYDKISKESGLDKTSTYTLPVEQIMHSDGSAELPYFEDLYKMAAEEFADSDLLNEAHPGGSQKLEGIDASDELAVVEDLKGSQKKILDMARKEVKLAEVVHQLAALATELDERFLPELANKVDQIAAFAASDPLVTKANEATSENPHPVVPQPKAPHQGMLAVQKAVNQIVEIYGASTGATLQPVPENGNVGDRATWRAVRNEPFNFQKGSFKNYRELLALLKTRLQSLYDFSGDNPASRDSIPVERETDWASEKKPFSM
jgi:hypothetical protein